MPPAYAPPPPDACSATSAFLRSSMSTRTSGSTTSFFGSNPQPIVTLGYKDRIPPLATGAPGLWLANTTQVYPEDRGTNYAVRLGEQAAAEVSGPA